MLLKNWVGRGQERERERERERGGRLKWELNIRLDWKLKSTSFLCKKEFVSV